MIPFYDVFPGFLAATLVPAYGALYFVQALRRAPTKYLAAVGLGLTFWYFFDTMGDAGSLGVNNPLYPPYLFGGAYHFILIVCFLAGISALAIFYTLAVPGHGSKPSRKALYLIPASVAIVMGVHGLGEGWDALSSVASAPSGSTGFQALIIAFGSLSSVISYPIHKFLEAAIVGVLYVGFVPGRESQGGHRWDIPFLGLLFAGPSLIGATLGYYLPLDTTYFFAFGVTSALYAALRLSEIMARAPDPGNAGPAHYGPKVIFGIGLGIMLLYTAALLH